ncbi:histidine kinase [Streptomyces cyaneogriseus subsp. noncyanogenus]|uniref:histidine kinase n=1 Tax=Streptomyces cyaneogriseus subsp. noncyanogenus TaxID=477245 RepID=A0A0C5GM39_9ACTN|nr:nitrate- and nitrite sensing domain-containing protein [Streptomyces cyaneogriseus]AJP05541.1 histidine kinase [Streptomyces cyaneogriseus subsp. noncyanogenus]
MRFRGTSIRRKIVALLLVPLLSLTAIWAFATVLTGREAGRLFSVSSVVEKIGYPVEDTVRVVQQERRQTLVYLADPRASEALTALRRSRTATDRAVAEVRGNARAAEVRDALSQDEDDRLTAVLDALGGLDSLRRSVEDGTVDRAQALVLYNRLVDSCQILLGGLHVVDNVDLDKQYRALVSLSRARELLSREDALLGSALVSGRLTRAEIRDVSDLVAQRTQLYDLNLPLLPAADRARYERFWKNASSAPLRVAEEAAVSSAAPSGTGIPSGVTARSWDTAAGKVLDELGTLDDRAADRYQDRVRPVAMAVIAKAVIAGVLGLLALLVSLFLSVRVGRGLIRDLRQLRMEAHEASGVRLPSVMRRLSAGEQVDVETEVPRLEYAKNEIGEVGQALNTLQRAAVEAAVKQAELRAGVSEVFVNLARRSQVLLHKQLTLLDTMERRTEDTEELADLFRLDHLTTRMRRHAEGLVILSGAAPSRQWRKPIQLMDVVRAAVAEVEDYERIEVRRLPRIAVIGPAVADLTHLVAELLENATVFSPPHTAVQVVGERVANGFTLEIHDRGLGMTADALLDANLRLAETPEFELTDTDRLGLFVVSRLAQRQNVRVSLQPSPYGGTTAVVFIPEPLLTDDAPDTNGIGFRLDRPQQVKKREPEEQRRAALSQAPAHLPGLPASLLDGPVELEAPVDLDALADFPDEDGERGGLLGTRHSLLPAQDGPGRATGGPHRAGTGTPGAEDGPGEQDHATSPVPLPRRRTPKLVSSHGRPVGDRDRREKPGAEPSTAVGGRAPEEDRGMAGKEQRDRGEQGEQGGPGERRRQREGDGPPALPTRRRGEAAAAVRPFPAREADGATGTTSLPARGAEAATGGPGATGGPATGSGPLPRRVRQASLAPQLRQDSEGPGDNGADPAERDAEEVRSRMAALQRGWRRGREENAAGDDADSGTAPRRTTKGDGR